MSAYGLDEAPPAPDGTADDRDAERTDERDRPQVDRTGPSPAVIAQSLGKEILHQVEIRPYTTIAVAAAAGYFIAIATPNWATRLAWTIGSRLAVSRIVAALE